MAALTSVVLQQDNGRADGGGGGGGIRRAPGRCDMVLDSSRDRSLVLVHTVCRGDLRTTPLQRSENPSIQSQLKKTKTNLKSNSAVRQHALA